MKRLIVLLALLASGCSSTADRAAGVWYDQAEMICYREECKACHGSSHVTCRPCRGQGQMKCNSCKKGIQRCRRCKGDGSYKGKPCKRCDGKGQFVCSSCGGDMLIGCRHCNAKGRIHCLQVMRITEPKPTGEDVWPRPTQPE